MAERLEIGPRAFVPFELLDYSGDSPHFVVRQTDVALTAADSKGFSDAQIDAGRQFLLGPTITLIDLMQQGIHFNNQARSGLTSAELQRALDTTGSIPGNGFYAREAHRIAIATWAQIPEYIKGVRFGRGLYQLSRHGRFAPPMTTSDLIERLEELRAGTVDAAGGKDTSAKETASVFFRVGAHLPIKEPTH